MAVKWIGKIWETRKILIIMYSKSAITNAYITYEFENNNDELYKDRTKWRKVQNSLGYQCKIVGIFKPKFSLVVFNKNYVKWDQMILILSKYCTPHSHEICSVQHVFRTRKLHKKKVFLCEYCKIFKNTYFEEHLWTAASAWMNAVILE